MKTVLPALDSLCGLLVGDALLIWSLFGSDTDHVTSVRLDQEFVAGFDLEFLARVVKSGAGDILLLV